MLSKEEWKRVCNLDNVRSDSTALHKCCFESIVRTTNSVTFQKTYFLQIVIIVHLSKFTKAVIITAVSAFIKSIKANFIYNDTQDM